MNTTTARWSKTTMYRMIEQWQESEMTQTAFCRDEKISKSVFLYWRRKYKHEKKGSSFLPVYVQPDRKVIESNVVEIHYPNRVRVVVESDAPVEFIRQLAGQ